MKLLGVVLLLCAVVFSHAKNNNVHKAYRSVRSLLDHHLFKRLSQPGPVREGETPYPSGARPHGNPNDPYPGRPNGPPSGPYVPYDRPGGPGEQGDIYGQQEGPYSQQGGPYGPQGGPYGPQGGPYGQQGGPYGQQGGPNGRPVSEPPSAMLAALDLMNRGGCDKEGVEELTELLKELAETDLDDLSEMTGADEIPNDKPSEDEIAFVSCVVMNILTLSDLAPLLGIPEDDLRAVYPMYVELILGFSNILQEEKENLDPDVDGEVIRQMEALLNVVSFLEYYGLFSLS